MNDPDMPLFCYCMDFGKRSFSIDVDHNGIIYWDDVTQRRENRPEGAKDLELRTICGDTNAAKRLHSEIDNYTIQFPLSPKLFSRIEQAAKLFHAGTWTFEHEAELDTVLEPLFWEYVNPYLEPPLKK